MSNSKLGSTKRPCEPKIVAETHEIMKKYQELVNLVTKGRPCKLDMLDQAK